MVEWMHCMLFRMMFKKILQIDQILKVLIKQVSKKESSRLVLIKEKVVSQVLDLEEEVKAKVKQKMEVVNHRYQQLMEVNMNIQLNRILPNSLLLKLKINLQDKVLLITMMKKTTMVKKYQKEWKGRCLQQKQSQLLVGKRKQS